MSAVVLVITPKNFFSLCQGTGKQVVSKTGWRVQTHTFFVETKCTLLRVRWKSLFSVRELRQLVSKKTSVLEFRVPIPREIARPSSRHLSKTHHGLLRPHGVRFPTARTRASRRVFQSLQARQGVEIGALPITHAAAESNGNNGVARALAPRRIDPRLAFDQTRDETLPSWPRTTLAGRRTPRAEAPGRSTSRENRIAPVTFVRRVLHFEPAERESGSDLGDIFFATISRFYRRNHGLTLPHPLAPTTVTPPGPTRR